MDRLEAALGQAWSRRGARRGADPDQAWLQNLLSSGSGEVQKLIKTMEPTTRIRDLGCSLEGDRRIKSNSLKSQILDGICFKIH